VLLRHADQAMYQAKAAGKNQYHLYDATRQQREQQKTSLRAAFKQALSDNALTLHYQPIVQLPSHQVIGCEALIRWQHPTQGLLYPEHFLHVIEHSDDDIQLGNWVLHQALKQLQQWQQQRLDLSLSINISGYHLQQDDFTAQLQQAASAYPDVSLDRLELEIIETTDISDFTKTLTTMNQCRELGVRFALDDFGNGYSSMVHIHRLPFSRLKVDCSLVANLLSSNRALEVVRSVAKLAELYQCELVAEGVESIEAAIIMMSLGCHYMQGFGISVPVPVSEFQQWFDSGHHHQPMSQIQPFDMDAEHAMLELEKLSHTLWVERICQYLQEPDKQPAAPQDLNEYACTFNQWYEGIGKENYGENDNYAFIPPKHRAVHDLAKELIACHKNGDTTTLRQRLSDFLALKEQFFSALDQLAQ
jgi:EAL domain-containing protein (putative c-di-GMP-specific phosphodiesterase class I)